MFRHGIKCTVDMQQISAGGIFLALRCHVMMMSWWLIRQLPEDGTVENVPIPGRPSTRKPTAWAKVFWKHDRYRIIQEPYPLISHYISESG
jgi:hypothetical protein